MRFLSNQIDVYPEYTGTAFTAILKHQPITDPNEVYDQTKREYAEKFDLNLSPPLGFSNDFAILVRGDVARKNNLKTISDAVPFRETGKPDSVRILCRAPTVTRDLPKLTILISRNSRAKWIFR